MTADTDPPMMFQIFNEIGIIEQLSRARLEAQLPGGLIAPHFAVLNHLMRGRDGAVPIDMARSFQVPKTSMTHTLKVLEKGGYVALRPNPDDGRSKQVWLTDAGRQMFAKTVAALGPTAAALQANLDMDKMAQLLPILSELRTIMDAARD